MKIRVLTVPAALLAFAAMPVFGQEAAAGPARSERGAASTIRDLTSQEQAWAQSCRQMAAIYREMAAPAESDSVQVREMKHQYERLAQTSENAAVVAEKMAADHARLSATQLYSAQAVTRNLNTGLFTR